MGPMGRFLYISDNGTSFTVRGNAAEAALTGGVASTALANFPRKWRTRKVIATDPTTHRSRRITVYDPANAAWTGSGGTVSLATLGSGTATVFNLEGRIGERRPA
jgi:hypothetical protein